MALNNSEQDALDFSRIILKDFLKEKNTEGSIFGSTEASTFSELEMKVWSEL